MSTPHTASDDLPSSLAPAEGWHVIHLYYNIDHGQWNLLSEEEQRAAKTDLAELVQEIRAHEDTHLLTYAVVTPKADIGFMLLTPDLGDALAFEKRLTLSLGPDIFTPVYSYLSQTERSEYTTTEEQYGKETLEEEKGLSPDSQDYKDGLAEFNKRMEHYLQHRLYPVLPAWPVVCFYPMSKRRSGADNWYSLSFDARKELMQGHARVGRTYAGKILQLITGSTGLDEHEWGVTLLAKDPIEIRKIVYEMRFDEVSARYGEFGDFYIGIQLPLNELFEKVCL